MASEQTWQALRNQAKADLHAATLAMLRQALRVRGITTLFPEALAAAPEGAAGQFVQLLLGDDWLLVEPAPRRPAPSSSTVHTRFNWPFLWPQHSSKQLMEQFALIHDAWLALEASEKEVCACFVCRCKGSSWDRMQSE